MGAWAADPFGNDTACDWKYELEEGGLSLVAETLQKIVDVGDDYVEAPEAEEAIAAADTLARLRGHSYVKDTYTESVDEWVAANPSTPSPELIELALAALKRIQGEDSELKELWEESDDSEWANNVSELEARLVR